MKLLRTTLALIAVFLIFHLLYIGQTLLLPLVIATAVVYLINVLTHTICMLRIGRISLPRPIAMVFAIAGIEEAPNIKHVLSKIDLQSYLQNFGGTVRSLVSSTGIIIVYLVFLLVEQRTFTKKIRALVRDPDRLEDVFELIEKIRSDIRLYIGIKVFTSLLTALTSYLVLNLVGVDFASFWAVLIFFLNFIPTIGSIIATAFPSIASPTSFGIEAGTSFQIVQTVRNFSG